MIFHSEIHKLMVSVWNKEELLQQSEGFIIIHIYKADCETDCSNF
jgi:hypothetical protein